MIYLCRINKHFCHSTILQFTQYSRIRNWLHCCIIQQNHYQYLYLIKKEFKKKDKNAKSEQTYPTTESFHTTSNFTNHNLSIEKFRERFEV